MWTVTGARLDRALLNKRGQRVPVAARWVTPYSGFCVEADVCESRSFEKFPTKVPLLYCTCKSRRGGGSQQRFGFTSLLL